MASVNSVKSGNENWQIEATSSVYTCWLPISVTVQRRLSLPARPGGPIVPEAPVGPFGPVTPVGPG